MSEDGKSVNLNTGKNVNGNTTFQLNFNLKTLIIVILFIISTVSGAWLDLKIRIDNASNNAKTEIAKFDTDIKDIKDGINELKDVNIKSVSDRLNLVDGKVQGLIIILQSSNSSHASHSNHSATPVNASNPTNPNNPN